MPFANKDQGDPLGDHGAAVFRDLDVVLKVRDPPGLGRRDTCESANEKRKKNRLGDFQVQNSPITNYWLRVRFGAREILRSA